MGGADIPVGKMSPAGSVLWALIPLFTLGLGTIFVLAWAAYRLRSRALGMAAVIALIMTVLAFALIGTSDDADSPASGVLIIFLIGGGLTTTFMVRRHFIEPGYGDRTGAKAGSAWPSLGRAVPRRGGVDPAIGEALERRQRRAEARRILERDPALARELRIGRPDLPRKFDDGGLVDVNHVPATMLATLPGFTPELADRVVRVRDEHRGFAFVEELEAYAHLPEGLADELTERLLFLR
ncbi:hypothetical protein RKD26_001984 [Streptomyces calvus]|uniref:ComEA family DNA-binding protein n=1 Tax=Streptomyces calvus TaxID=67282 RepID=UPI00351466C4